MGRCLDHAGEALKNGIEGECPAPSALSGHSHVESGQQDASIGRVHEGEYKC